MKTYTKKSSVLSRYLALLCLAVMTIGVTEVAQADSGTYHSSDAWVAGVCGDVQGLVDADSKGKFLPIPVPVNVTLGVPADGRKFTDAQIKEVAEALLADKAPQRAIDWLVSYDEKTLNSIRLQERAQANRKLTGRSPLPTDELREHLSDLLSNNYIYLSTRIPYNNPNAIAQDTVRHYYTAYALFQIEVNPQAVLSAVESGNITSYRGISYSLKCVSSGSFGFHTSLPELLTKKVASLHQSFVVSESDPYTLALGADKDLNNGGLVRIYRASTDPDGKRFSTPLGYARVFDVQTDKARLMPVSLGAKKMQPEDVAVHASDKRATLKLEGAYMKGLWGFNVGFNYLCSTNNYGWSLRFLLEAGYGGAGKKDNDKPSEPDFEPLHSYSVAAGVGLSKTFAGCLEVMPFVSLGYSYLHTSEMCTYTIPDNPLCPDLSGDFIKRVPLNANYFRVPMGVTLGLDLSYPLQLVFTAGYTQIGRAHV